MPATIRGAGTADRRSRARLCLQGALAILWLVACNARPPARVSVPVQPEHRPAPAAPAPASPPIATLSLKPLLEHDLYQRLWAIENAGDRRRMIVGPLRCEVTPDQVILADDRFGFHIVAAARAGRGWLFVAADGAVARADSFLGRLEPLGRVPAPYWNASTGAGPSLQVSDGRLAIATQDPRANLWTTDGSAAVAPARGVPPGIVQSAAFVDGRHGMIVVDGGQLFATRDGAASFDRVDLGDDAAATVIADHGALRVTTSSGIVVFAPDGTRRPRGNLGPTEAATPVYESDDRKLVGRLFIALVRRYGALLAESFGWAVTGDGRILVPFEYGLRPMSGLPDAEIAEFQHGRHCRAARWGKDYAVSCIDGDVFRVDATTLQATRAIAGAGNSLGTLFEDGVHAAWVCDVGRSTAQLCVWSDRGILRQPLEPAPPQQSIIGSHGSEVVLWQTAAKQLVLVDAATGSHRSISLALPPAMAVPRRHAWQLSADGAIAHVEARDPRAAPAGVRWLVRVGLTDGAMTSVQLPEGATRTGFVTAQRGVAVDDDTHRVWITRDGGSRWEEQGGFAGRVWLARPLRREPPEAHSPVTCAGKRCVIDVDTLISFDGSSAIAQDRVLASPALPRTAPAGPSQVPPAGAALACATRDLEHPALPRSDARDDSVMQFENPNVSATLHLTAAGLGDVTWEGTDARGRYQTRHAGDPGPPPSAHDDRHSYELASASRDGVLIEATPLWRPPSASPPATYHLIWMPAGGHAQQTLREAGNTARLEDTLALPDGRLAVLLGLGQPDRRSFRVDFHRLVVVDRTRGVIARRTFAWNYRIAGIAFFHGTVGVQFAESDPMSPHWFLPISGAPATPEPVSVDLLSTPICSRQSRAAVVAIAVENVWPSSDRTAEYPIARVYLRGEPRACVQSVEFRDPRLQGRDLFLTASSSGDLTTRLDLGDVHTYREMSCGFETEPDQYIAALGHADLQYAWGEYRESPAWQKYHREQARKAAEQDGDD